MFSPDPLAAPDRRMRLPALTLESGAVLAAPEIAFATYGALAPDRGNAVLVCHALTGDQHVAGIDPRSGKPGWWSRLVGPGLPIDPARHFIVCANVIGGCMGSSGPASLDPATGAAYAMAFPVITIRDMVRAQAALLDALGVGQLLAVAGGSMGGMQALDWAVAYPERVRSVVAIATAARHTAQNIAYHEVGRQAIMADPDWAKGAYYNTGRTPVAGLAVAAGTRVEAPVEIVALLSGRVPCATYDRSYLKLGDGAALTLIERHAALGEAKSLAASVLVVAIGDRAAFEHLVRIDGLGPQALHLGTTLVRIGAEAKFESTTLLATGGVTRRQAYVEFVGENATAHLYGVSLLDGRSHADTTLIVTHTAAHCESRELFKHILDDDATGIYQGRVVVAPGAQKTDGKMLSKCIFLGEGANMYNKPELEIFADDVVCGHGATVGALDDDQLFYLRARGIPLREAQALLLEAFAAEAIETVSVDAVKDEMSARIGQWLRQHGR